MHPRRRSSPFYPTVAALLLAAAACAPEAPGPEAAGASPAAAASAGTSPARGVLAGVDVLLADSLHLVRGRRVGLVTNHTGVSGLHAAPGGPPATTVDLLHGHSDLELAALFGPEHGMAGTEEGRVASGHDERTGLPVYSLYTETRRPLPHMLEGLDVLVFDIQDVGARYYTYVSTMALAMEAAGQAGIPFVVLDRPNPIGGELVQGNVLDPAWASFVGMYPVPMRHGMTPGELARLIRGAFGVAAELHVVPAEGWRRELWFDVTGLPWTPPSPNMPSVESATHYPGTCLFEGTNLSVGRGTGQAFQWIGAPWLDGVELAARLEAYGLAGVRFEPATFTPVDPGDGKWGGTPVHGVRFVTTDRAAYDPTLAAVAALVETRRMSGDRWEWRPAHFDRLAGTDELRRMVEDGRSLEEITTSWNARLEAFRELRGDYLIYP